MSVESSAKRTKLLDVGETPHRCGDCAPGEAAGNNPVSKKLEEDMHRQVIEMLESGVIERSTSAWSTNQETDVTKVTGYNIKYRLHYIRVSFCKY